MSHFRMDVDGFIRYNTQKEIEAILSWFQNWKENEKFNFLQNFKNLIRPDITDIMNQVNNIKIER